MLYSSFGDDLAKVSKFLKEHGFPPYVNGKVKGQDEFTFPLHMAVMQNDEEMARLLVRCGADTTLRDSSGKTAWELQADFKTPPLSSSQCSFRSAFSTLKRALTIL